LSCQGGFIEVDTDVMRDVLKEVVNEAVKEVIGDFPTGCQRDCKRGSEKGLIDCLRFYVPLKNFSLIWRSHHVREVVT
jgi:hypothetical protein